MIPRLFLLVRLSPIGRDAIEVFVRTGAPREREQLAGVLHDPTPRELPVLSQAVDALLAEVDRLGRYPSGEPRTLPVFVGATPALFDAGLTRLSLRTIAGGRLTPVRLARNTWSRRAPIALPLHVLAIDEAATALDAALGADHGYAGLETERSTTPEVIDRLRRAQVDVLVLGARAPAVLEALDRAHLPMRHRPRLVVVAGLEPRARARVEVMAPTAGTSRITLDAPPELAPRLGALLRALMHDIPLHDALRTADADATLVGDPLANEDLRLARTMFELLTESLDVEQHTLPPRRVETPRGLVVDAPFELVERARARAVDFAREVRGLGPLWEMTRQISEAKRLSRAPTYRAAVRAVAAELPEARAEDAVGRSVDLRLERLDTQPRHVASLRDTLWVARDVALEARRRYRVRLQIGRALEGSLLDAPVPSLDALLPPAEPEEVRKLDVVLFAQDFTLLTRRVVSIALPPHGPSDAATFEVLTPAEPRAQAQLRVAVYFGNNLVQSFRLVTRIEPEEGPSADGVVTRFELEISRSVEHLDGERYGARRISLAMNHGVSGTHALMFKRGAKAEDVSLSLDFEQKRMEELRAALREATLLGQNLPKYELGRPRPADFDADLRKLADRGRSLWDVIALSNRQLEAELRHLRTTADEIVQVVRLNPSFAFPWHALYDFEIPDDASAPVCVGRDHDGATCAHDHETRDVFCVRGFWGIRHKLETLIWVGRAEGPPEPIRGRSRRAAIRLIAETTPELTNEVIAPLHAKRPDVAAPLAAGEDPLAVLFESTPRPAIYAVLGHHETEGGTTSRIEVGRSGATIDAKKLTRRCTGPAWTSERPVVVLASCDMMLATATTSTDYVMPLLSKGAAAVIGTEALVFEDLARFFLTRFLTAMLDGRAFVDAVRDAQRAIFERHIPLAFTFTAFGSAELALVE